MKHCTVEFETTETGGTVEISMGFHATVGKTVWVGKWYKPWTWFGERYQAATLEGLTAVSAAIVKPVGPENVKFKDGFSRWPK